MRKIGILGGMSWASSQIYYGTINKEVLRLTNYGAAGEFLLWSFDTNSIEQLMVSNKWGVIAEKLGIAADHLINCGAELLAIASNTIHYVIDSGLINFNVPIIHIRDSIKRSLVNQSLSKVGVIGTSVTMSNDLYRDIAINNSNSGTVYPPKELWPVIDDMIFGRLSRGKINENDKIMLESVVKDFKSNGIYHVILGCTELNILNVASEGTVFIDSADVHAKDIARQIVIEQTDIARI